MFEQLTQRLQGTLRAMRGSVKIDAAGFDAMARELRIALLEADVQFGVVKEFLDAVRAKALGRDVLESLTPGQQVVKIVHEQLIELLGGEPRQLRFQGSGPHVLMLVGLQGTGKTTTVGKLGVWLRGQGRSPLLVSVDIHRPAARDQLRLLGEQSGLEVYAGAGDVASGLAGEALREARRRGDDVLIVDTAGRLHVDEEMMGEAVDVASVVQPEVILYVADSLAGQDAVQAATAFAESLPVDGHVLTKLDGDARGGAALSVVAATGQPVYFAGVGESVDDLEVFHPDRIASRILGMGDVLSLVEKVQAKVDVEQAAKIEKRVRRGEFSLEDFGDQLRQMRRMGPMSQLLELLPGAGAQDLSKLAPDEAELTRIQAIIDSMTPQERRQPQIMNSSRRRRIAAGSGTGVQDVNRLLKQFARTRKLMKKLGKKGRRNPPWANLPGF